MVGSPGIPAAVRERPPRNGPIERYFIPLKSGSPSFFSSLSLSSFADGSEAAGVFFCAASTLGFPSFCWEKVRVTEHRTNKASIATRTRSLWIWRWIMNSMAPEKNLLWLMLMPEARKVQTDGLPDGGPILRRREEEGLLLNSPVVEFPCVPPCPLWLRFAPVLTLPASGYVPA